MQALCRSQAAQTQQPRLPQLARRASAPPPAAAPHAASSAAAAAVRCGTAAQSAAGRTGGRTRRSAGVCRQSGWLRVADRRAHSHNMTATLLLLQMHLLQLACSVTRLVFCECSNRRIPRVCQCVAVGTCHRINMGLRPAASRLS